MKKVPIINSCLECPFIDYLDKMYTKRCKKLFRDLSEKVILYGLIEEDCPLPEAKQLLKEM